MVISDCVMMKVVNLSGITNSPCFVVELDNLLVMLDCALDLSSLYHYLPLPLVHSASLSNLPSWLGCNDVKLVDDYPFVDADPEFGIPETQLIPISSIDVILISNYRSLLALPYITEKLGFTGLVFATDPTVNYGRLLLEELSEFVSAAPKHRCSRTWKVGSTVKQVFPKITSVPASWQPFLSKDDIDTCMRKIKTVSFEENVSLYGAASAAAHSSGLSIGSSNWSITCGASKIVYLSGSSQFVTHCRPLDVHALRSPDLLIVSDITNAPNTEPDIALQRFCDALLATLKVGGNVLIPCTPTGVIYDLLECLSGFLDSSGFGHVPLCFISPVADASLAHANIYSEWLNTAKQSKVYLPEPPFIHSNMIKANGLFVYSHIHGAFSETYRSPSIVFTGHPSLRFGPAVHFVELWGQSDANSVIFIEPDFPYREALKPFHNCKLKVFSSPIDTRLTLSQLNKLFSELNCKNTVVPSAVNSAMSQFTSTDPTKATEFSNVSSLSRAEVADFKDDSLYQTLDIACSVARQCKVEKLSPEKLSFLPVIGEFHVHNHEAVIRHIDLDAAPQLQVPRPFVWGVLGLEGLLKELRLRRITNVKVEDLGPNKMISIGSAEDPDGMILVGESSTNVVGCKTENLRKTVADSLVACLKKL